MALSKLQPRSCEWCSHSPSAHLDGRCALCGCSGRPLEAAQEALPFRTTLPIRRRPTKRR